MASQQMELIGARDCGFNAMSWVIAADTIILELSEGPDTLNPELNPDNIVRRISDEFGVKLQTDEELVAWHGIALSLYVNAQSGYCDWHPNYPLFDRSLIGNQP